MYMFIRLGEHIMKEFWEYISILIQGISTSEIFIEGVGLNSLTWRKNDNYEHAYRKKVRRRKIKEIENARYKMWSVVK